MGLWYKYKRTFTEPKGLHNEEAMDSMFQGTCITVLDLYKNPQDNLDNTMRTFDESDIHKN